MLSCPGGNEDIIELHNSDVKKGEGGAVTDLDSGVLNPWVLSAVRHAIVPGQVEA